MGGGANDIEDVAKDIADIKQLLQELQNLFKPTLTTDGLKIRGGRCTIEEGGYCMIGNMCYFQIKIKTTTSFAGPNYWTFIDNLPLPKGSNGNSGIVACSVTCTGAYTGAKTLSLEHNTSDVPGASLVVHNNDSIASGINLYFTGFYLTDQDN